MCQKSLHQNFKLILFAGERGGGKHLVSVEGAKEKLERNSA